MPAPILVLPKRDLNRLRKEIPAHQSVTQAQEPVSSMQAWLWVRALSTHPASPVQLPTFRCPLGEEGEELCQVPHIPFFRFSSMPSHSLPSTRGAIRVKYSGALAAHNL